MKRLVTLFAITMAIIVSFDGMAQMSKKEAKEWKKRMKKTSPESFKNMIDENKSMKSQVSSLRSELDNVDDQLASKDDQINQYAAQAADLRDQLAKVNSKYASSSSGGNIDENVGVIFKVQIGAYKEIDLSEDNSSSFNSEKGDLNKYTIGVFKDYWEADTFKKYVREMGVKDAWIVSYRDGQRVDIKDVLEGKS
ncbi:MAG: Ezrin/radixin/moesin family protein [Cytophagales bacterium]|nr:Ezrin/radixin/moesin family protein [Cytophagales bacterium]